MDEGKAQPGKTSENNPRRRRTVREHGPDPVDVHVGRRLRQARFLAGLSQEELGAGIGVSFQAVQKYEHGENRLSASRLYRAAKLLLRPVAFFFDEYEGEALPTSGGGFSRDEIELVRHFRQIPSEEVREHLLQMTKRISGLENPSPTESEEGTAARRA
jgi:transcriptional regulator with XRE-family HTH domain